MKDSTSLISVITPTHDPRWLYETLFSLKAQTYDGRWEWLVVPNEGTSIPQEVIEHPNTRVIPYAGPLGRIGTVKKFACEKAGGEIVVELDHDDLLTNDALQVIAETFASEDVDFVYSNHAEFQDGTWQPHIYDASYGWQTRENQYDGHGVIEIVAFPPTGQSHAVVHFAPNHVRAWRARAYWDIGGHDPEMEVADDHDLVCRFYLHKKVKHIDRLLYLYRLHGDNSYLRRNAEVQEGTALVRDKYVWKLAERWADLEKLPKVDLGAARNKPKEYIGVDLEPGTDIQHDVRKGLPFKDNSVGLVRAFDFLEHIPDKVALMNEIYRVLVDGGWLISMTPSSDGRGAFQDPSHCSYWNENSFWYFTNKVYADYAPTIACRFQAVRLKTMFPSDFHQENKIPYVYADMTAIKTWRRRPGLTLI